MLTGRVTEAHRTNYTVAVATGEVLATVRGNFHELGDFPKVGDYVEVEMVDEEKGVIERVQERRSTVKRKAADSDEEQIIAANVDLIFVVMGLDGDFSVSRLERYLLLAQQSAIPAVIILNKADVCDTLAERTAEVSAIAADTPVFAVSALTGAGMEAVLARIETGITTVLLGSSGAGKSTITNWLLDDQRQAVNTIRADDSRGRHTTTSRQLFTLPTGGFLIDTPGMRELGVLEVETEDEQAVFARVEQFAAQCKFRNCDHERSAGCAVLAALSTGALTERELLNYQKLLRERAFLESKEAGASKRYAAQNKKRENQKNAAVERQRLSRGLRGR